MGRVRIVTLLASLALAVAACGARIEPIAIGPDQGVPGVGPGDAGVVAPGEQVAPDQVPQTGVATAPGQTGGPGGATQTAGPGQQTACRATRASDTGVTATTIKLGAVIMLTGPFPGQFDPARDAVDAHFKMVNARGGICGRQVQVVFKDDNGDVKRNAAVARQLIDEEKVFAFVGNFSPFDDGIASVACNKPIPDLAFPFSERHSYCSNTFAVPGMGAWRHIGDGASGTTYLTRTNGIKRVAMFWVREADVSKVSAWGFEAAIIKNNPGVEICYEKETSVFETGFRQYVSQLGDRCGDPSEVAVYSTMENNNNIRLAEAMREQGYEPKVFGVTFSSYLPSFISQARGATEGAYLALPFIPLERCTQRSGRPVAPCSHAALDTYIRALNTYRPTADVPGSFGAGAWAQAALFTEAATRCGAGLTRACVMQQLRSMGEFSAGGLVSPKRPSQQTPYHADLIVQVRGGRFVEIPRPAGAAGPREGPEFWNDTPIFDWRAYYCANREKFPNRAEKDRVLQC